MKKFVFLMALVLMLGIDAFAQSYPLVSFRDIQFMPDSLLSLTKDTSYYNYDTVRVIGTVMVAPIVHQTGDRRRIIAAGARWDIYVQDTNSGIWGGLNILQQDTTAAFQSTGFDLIDTAQIVEFTGVISPFNNATQMNILLNPVTPVNILGTLSKRPAPIEKSITDFMNNGISLLEGRKYESMYCVIRNVITSDRNTTSGTFRINDGQGNYMAMYDQSGYFTKRTHKLGTYDPPADGTVLSSIRGIVLPYGGYYEIIPLYPGDIVVGATPPVVSNVTRDKGEVGLNTAVTVSSKAVDLDGFVNNVKLVYRKNMTGASITVPMTRGIADTTIYTATIPGFATDSTYVDYYITATDNEGRVSVNPSDTVHNRFSYFALNRPVTIQDVQYSPLGSGYSPYNNFRVTVSGIVTADTTDIPGWGSTALRVYMQNGTGAWSGIWINGLAALNVHRGDKITVSGKVVENYGVTVIDSITSIVTVSSGNALPAPVVLSTADIGVLAGGTVGAEKYESVLVEYDNVNITATNADATANNGEMYVADASGQNTRVELQDGNHSYNNGWETGLPGISVVKGAHLDKIKGILYFSYSYYKLVPRKDDDFVNYNGIKDNDASVANYNLSQNYPNPFNPTTAIEFSMAKPGYVSIEVYNILGQLVKTLVNSEQPAGNHRVIFDAHDLPSGVYMYSLKTNEFSSVKKMLLLK